MKNKCLILVWFFLFFLMNGCKDQVPGKVEIFSVENLTHNSMVVFSGISDLRDDVFPQLNGVTAQKLSPQNSAPLSFPGINTSTTFESGMTGVSGLEPDTRYIIRAYNETDEGIVYSDTMVIKTLAVDCMTDSRDGKSYPVKTYGNQVWMVQNMDYQTPASLVFENIPGKYPSGFGRLYSYQEAVHACPPGWRLPSDADWKLLEEWIGIPKGELDNTELRGSPAGGRMKEPGVRLWESESARHSTNKSGFTVLPSGWYRTEKKEFTYAKTCAGFWSVSEDLKTAYVRLFYVNTDAVSRTGMDINSLFLSLRCVRN